MPCPVAWEYLALLQESGRKSEAISRSQLCICLSVSLFSLFLSLYLSLFSILGVCHSSSVPGLQESGVRNLTFCDDEVTGAYYSDPELGQHSLQRYS